MKSSTFELDPKEFSLWPKKTLFADATREIHCVEDVSILPTRAANQNTGLASSCPLGTTYRIIKRFSRRSNSNRKKYQHGTKSIKHSRVLCAFGNVHYITYLQSIRIVRGFMRVACTRKCPFVRGTGKGFLKIPVNSTSSPTFALFADD